MRIVIATALFPPDVADPAPYVKELATRLGSDHDVTVLTYGTLPESIAGVEVIAVAKHTALPQRLWKFFTTLLRLARDTDVVLIHNAPSTELPACAAQFFVRKPSWILVDSDTKIRYTGNKASLHRLAVKQLQRASVQLPLPRPEQHPFRPPTETQWKLYETSWEEHLQALEKTFYATH